MLQGWPQRELANAALLTELREAHDVDEERSRHDRDADRQEAEETARQVADAAAAMMRTVPLVPASLDTKLISKPETFSGQDTEWPRWSLIAESVSGSSVGDGCKNSLSPEDPQQNADRVDPEPGHGGLEAHLNFTPAMLLKRKVMEKVETVEHGEGSRL